MSVLFKALFIMYLWPPAGTSAYLEEVFHSFGSGRVWGGRPTEEEYAHPYPKHEALLPVLVSP